MFRELLLLALLALGDPLSCKYLCGFELGNNQELRTNAATGTASVVSSVTNGAPHSGTYCFKANPSGASTGYGRMAHYDASGALVIFSFPNFYARFYFYCHTAPGSASEEICWIYNLGLQVRIDSARKLSLWNNTTQLGSTGANALSLDTWYRIDVKRIAGTDTAFEVRLNGTVEVTTTFTHASNATEFEIGKTANRNDQSVEFYYDDVYIEDTEYPPDGKIVVLKPTGGSGAGQYDSWNDSTLSTTPGLATSVDDLPNNTTDYWYFQNSTTARNSCLMEDCSVQSISGTINAVQGVGLVGYSGSSASTKFTLRSATTDTDTSGTAQGTYLPMGIARSTDPGNGNVAWTSSAVDAIELGVLSNNTQARPQRCTALYLMVDFLPAAATDYPVNLEPGSYNLTGVALTSLAARMANLETGAYALTGVDLTAARGFTVNLEVGGYSVTGVDLTPLAGRALQLEPGVYAISGNDLAALAGRTLNLEPGSYLITGNDLVAARGYLLNLEPGNYSITGIDLNALAARVVELAPGVYDVTGVDLAALKGATLNLEPGAYAISGTDLIPLAARLVNLEPGIYDLNGFDLTLVYTPAGAYDVELEPGTYSLSGVDLTALAGRVVILTPGDYALTGIDLAALAGRVGNLEPGVYALTGVSLSPLAGRALNLESGAYALSGSDLTSLAARALSLDPGVYVLSGADLTALAGRAANLEPGIYALTGFDLTLVYTPVGGYEVFLEPGTYQLTGSDLDALAGRVLNLEPGVYVISGVDMTALADRMANLEPGAYIISGVDADFVWSGAAGPEVPLYVLQFRDTRRR